MTACQLRSPPPQPPAVWLDPTVRVCAAACLTGLGGFLAWATFAPLAEGVAVTGQIVVENDRRVVQHLEGGIISRLHVSEGDAVEAGAVLLELGDIAASAQREQAAKDVATLLLAQARLEAVLGGGPMGAVDLTFLRLPARDEADIRNRQANLYRQQREAASAQVAVLNSKRQSLSDSGRAKDGQILATEKALGVTREELALQEQLLERRLTRLERVQGLQRQVATLEADLQRLRADQGLAESESLVVAQEVLESGARRREEAATELAAVKSDLLSKIEALRAADDMMERLFVRAPQAGVVMNLAFNTKGGVVRPGESILEIVPRESALLAAVQLRPQDRDVVHVGQSVKAKLSAYKSWATPSVTGVIVSVSADLKRVPETGMQYYEARVELDEAALRSAGLEGMPGMPVDASIASGAKRTLLDYMFEPLLDSLGRATPA